jgi:hypothetical protein
MAINQENLKKIQAAASKARSQVNVGNPTTGLILVKRGSPTKIL